MEGGMKPWRIQKVENNSLSLEDYEKPLPPPPDGFFWNKAVDGGWELLQHPGLGLDSRINTSLTSTIEHVILPSDTLPGICLRYGVSVVDIRRLNQFSGNFFRCKTVLKIPVQRGVSINIQEETPEVILQRFKNATNETAEESRFYLDEHRWDLSKALEAWKNDNEWSKDKGENTVKKFSKHMKPPENIVIPVSIQPATMSLQTAFGRFSNHNIVMASQVHDDLSELKIPLMAQYSNIIN